MVEERLQVKFNVVYIRELIESVKREETENFIERCTCKGNFQNKSTDLCKFQENYNNQKDQRKTTQ